MKALIRAGLVAVAALFGVSMVTPPPAQAEPHGGTLDRGDGIHTESWFLNDSFLILPEDIADATAQGKMFVIIWEQPGCYTCERLHEVNLQDEGIKAYLQEHFVVMTMNMFGEVEVTDVDGTPMPEKDLAHKHRINFTPTTVFLNDKGEEVFRLPGYQSPFFWLAGFVFVKEQGYADAESRGMLPRWLSANRDLVVAAYGREPSE